VNFAIGPISCSSAPRNARAMKTQRRLRLARLLRSVGLISKSKIFESPQEALRVQRFKRDQFSPSTKAFAIAIDGGGFVATSTGSFSIHLRTSAARPFSLSHSIRVRGPRDCELRPASPFREARRISLDSTSGKFETKKIIAEGDLLTHLQLLGKRVRPLEFVSLESIAEQGPERTGVKRWHLCQSFQDLTDSSLFSGTSEWIRSTARLNR